MAALGATDDAPTTAAGRHRHGGPDAHPRRRQPRLGDGLRRARPRGHQAGPRRRLARDVAVAEHALPRARHLRPRLGAAHRPLLGLRLRARALRALVGARRRDDAARPGLRLPLRRPPRRGRQHDAADAADLDRAALGERPAEGGPAAALLQAIGGLEAFRRSVTGPADAYPVARFLLFEPTYPHSVAAALELLHARLTDADPSYRTAPPLLRLARLRAELEFHHGAARGRAGRAAGGAARARRRRARRGRRRDRDSATSAAPPPSRTWSR